jgi:FMN phosphatase YigB (HAD superfamily)
MESAPLDLVTSSARTGLVDALDALLAAGIKLGVVSDYPAARKLRALGIADRIEVVVSAQDPRVGAFKPNPLGIRTALDDLGVGCPEALYVGDRADVDAAAAAALGMRCVLIGRPARRPLDVDARQVRSFDQLVDVVVRG